MERNHIILKRFWVNSPIINVLIRIYELPIEHFYVLNICVIAFAIGPIVSIGERTQKCEMFHYAWVLVELGLCKKKEEFVMYETYGHCSIASIGYERLP